MNKIKTAIIHWLGGVTAQERTACFADGRRVEATIIQRALRDLNGLSAEERCDAAWNFVTAEVNDMNKRYNEEV